MLRSKILMYIISWILPRDSEQAGNIFSFGQHNGDLNGGNYQVLMIYRSTAWWAPCFNAIPEGDEIVAHWEGDNSVSIIQIGYILLNNC